MNEITSKNNTIKTILIAILSILLVGCVGFIAYDKLIKKEEPKTEENNKVEDDKQNDNKIEENVGNLINDMKNFPQKSDDTIIYEGSLKDFINKKEIDLDTNFKNVKKSINDIEYTISCSNYNPEEKELEHTFYNCNEVGFDFEKYNTTIDYVVSNIGCSDETYIILTENYLIEQGLSGCGGGGQINIFDKHGKKIFNIESSVWRYSLFSSDGESSSDTDYSAKITVVDDVLYYVTYNTENGNELYFEAYNLKTNEKIRIQTFEAIPSGISA